MDALQSVFGQLREAEGLVLSQFDVHIAAIVTTTAAALFFTLSLILLALRTGRLAERVDTLVRVVEGLKRLEEARLYRELTSPARRTKERVGNGIAGNEELRTSQLHS